ncbi:MAG: hypothetical protein ACI8RZ_003374 [Myxococcota bacterium]|jgi:hypothetical protein
MRTMTMMMVSGLLLAACGDKDDDTGADAVSGDDAQLAEDLWTATSGYSSWSQLKSWTGVTASTDGTHGDYVQIWANPVAYDALAAGTAVPDGGILVKEGYTDEAGTDLKGISVMQKITDYDSTNGDWFWAQYDSSGAASVSGAASGCYGCHSAYGDYTAFDEL